jgi:hypothetical protein
MSRGIRHLPVFPTPVERTLTVKTIVLVLLALVLATGTVTLTGCGGDATTKKADDTKK